MNLFAWTLTGFALIAVAFHFTRILRHLVEQRRAEAALTSLLSRDAEFRESITKVADNVYQYGFVRPDLFGDLECVIVSRVHDLDVDPKAVVEALRQPSVQGRQRYAIKIAKEALAQMVDIPVSELELDSRDLTRARHDAAGVSPVRPHPTA